MLRRLVNTLFIYNFLLTHFLHYFNVWTPEGSTGLIWNEDRREIGVIRKAFIEETFVVCSSSVGLVSIVNKDSMDEIVFMFLVINVFCRYVLFFYDEMIGVFWEDTF